MLGWCVCPVATKPRRGRVFRTKNPPMLQSGCRAACMPLHRAAANGIDRCVFSVSGCRKWPLVRCSRAFACFFRLAFHSAGKGTRYSPNGICPSGYRALQRGELSRTDGEITMRHIAAAPVRNCPIGTNAPFHQLLDQRRVRTHPVSNRSGKEFQLHVFNQGELA